MNTTNKKPRYFRLVIPLGMVLGLGAFGLESLTESSGASDSQTYTYDSAGRLVQAAYGDGYVINYTYDANGNMLTFVVKKKEKIFFDGFEALAFLNPLNWGK